MIVEHQPYNFFNFKAPGIIPVVENTRQFIDTLPVCFDDDIKFQVLLQADWICFIAFMMQRPISDFKLHIIDKLEPNTNVEISNNIIATLTNANLVFERHIYQTDATAGIMLYWPHGIPNLATILTKGKCYHLAIEVNNTANSTPNEYLYATRPIQYIDKAYTSTIEYKDYQTSFDFQYLEDNHTNKVRLYTHLQKPQYPSDVEVYINSKGKRIMNKSVTKAIYEGITKQATKELHQCLQQALLHDYVRIIGNGYDVEGTLEGGYGIEYADKPMLNKAPGTYTFGVSKYYVTNQNSGILPTPGPVQIDTIANNGIAFFLASNFIDAGLTVTATLYTAGQVFVSSTNGTLAGGFWSFGIGSLASASPYILRIQSTYANGAYKSKYLTFNFTTL